MCNYFAHGTGDFFSVDYMVQLIIKKFQLILQQELTQKLKPSGLFDLRDTVDFRPRVADATIDTTTTIQSQTHIKLHLNHLILVQELFAGTGSSEILIPKDNSQFQYDFDFFLGRTDLWYS